MANYSAQQVANSLLAFGNSYGDTLTNLKLQKLLYYTQAWYLAFNDDPLFDEDFEAWIRGPVMPSVWRKFKEFKHRPIVDVDVNDRAKGEHINAHITEIFRVYGSMSGFDLERLTHTEAPWKDARAGISHDKPSRTPISKDAMKRFYWAKLHVEEG